MGFPHVRLVSHSINMHYSFATAFKVYIEVSIVDTIFVQCFTLSLASCTQTQTQTNKHCFFFSEKKLHFYRINAMCVCVSCTFFFFARDLFYAFTLFRSIVSLALMQSAFVTVTVTFRCCRHSFASSTHRT